MDSKAHPPNRQDDNASSRAGPTTATSGMAGWRWLLFVAMARLELREDIYLRIPGTMMPMRAAGAAIDHPEKPDLI